MVGLDQLLDLAGAELVQGGADAFDAVVIDSREAKPGDLFVAVRAARDGHDFISDAVQRGVSGVLIDDCTLQPPPGATVIRVPDTLHALQALARQFRAASFARFVAITGSVGKTTTKDLIAHVLAGSGNVVASVKSYNNHLGVPLTITRVSSSTQEVINEVGTNHRGEIARLADIVRPDIGVVTNVGYAHIGNFASQEELADEKTDLLEAVRQGGTWIVNGDDPLLMAAVMRRNRGHARLLMVGSNSANHVRIGNVDVSPAGTSGTLSVDDAVLEFRLPMAGRHFAYTAAFAMAVSVSLGRDPREVVDRLDSFPVPDGRANMREITSRLRMIDDSYNASPDSVLAALDTLSSDPATNKIAVLGEMRELGKWSERLHEEVADRVAQQATHLIAVGGTASIVVSSATAAGLPRQNGLIAESATSAATTLNGLLKSLDGTTTVLVKGSRFMHMERVALKLGGVSEVKCPLELCDLYIHCGSCSRLEGTAL